MRASRVVQAALACGAVLLAGCGAERPGVVEPAPEYVEGPPRYQLTGTYPINGAIGVSLTPAIRATFWEATDPEMLSNVSITMSEDYNSPLIPGTISLQSRAAIFTPSVPLKPQRHYVVTVTARPRTTAGASVPMGRHSWVFYTRGSE